MKTFPQCCLATLFFSIDSAEPHIFLSLGLVCFLCFMIYQLLGVTWFQSHLCSRTVMVLFYPELGEGKGVHTFPKSISLKVNVIAWLEFKLTHHNVTGKRINHYTIDTSLIFLETSPKKKSNFENKTCLSFTDNHFILGFLPRRSSDNLPLFDSFKTHCIIFIQSGAGSCKHLNILAWQIWVENMRTERME